MDSRRTALVRRVPIDSVHRRTVAEQFRRIMLTGFAVTFPFLVTLLVLGFVLNFLSNLLNPFVGLLQLVGVANGGNVVVAQGAALVGIAGVVFVTGVVAEKSPDSRVGDAVAGVVEDIPAVGSVYTSFDRMGEALLRSDSGSFREVKMVEFPHRNTYAIAFLTAEAPDGVVVDGEESMQVLFVPMAPNPVMGGHLVCVPEDRVYDVDMTMQQAFQAIVTSGVGVDKMEA